MIFVGVTVSVWISRMRIFNLFDNTSTRSRLLIFLIVLVKYSYEENTTAKWFNTTDPKQLVNAKCLIEYTSNCFLLDVCKVIDRFRATPSHQILPGMYVIVDRERFDDTKETPTDIFQRAMTTNYSNDFQIYAHQKLNTFLDTISLTLKIMDKNSAFNVRNLSDALIGQLLPLSTAVFQNIEIDISMIEEFLSYKFSVPRTVTTMFKKVKVFFKDHLPDLAALRRRGKKKGHKDGVLWAVGAIAALGTSALFAFTGKAALTSLLALMLSMMCYFKGQGSSHYTSGSIVEPLPYSRQQCNEAIIDVNGRGEHSSTSIVGYKKRTTEDPWNYPRYASTSNEHLYDSRTEPPIYRGDESYNRIYNK